ncbi:MAG: hypothetical protein H7145_18085 [Akkermansiaceae bacterium]|nr:hypothetical protein [Armatimonadota bacterium]
MGLFRTFFRTGGRFAFVAVATVYAAMTFLALRFVYVYAVDIAFADEWNDTVRRAAGEIPYSWEWLWSRWNEHRIVLPRILQHGILYLSGNQLVPVMYFNVCLASAAVLVLWRAAIVLRGRFGGTRGTALTDAFFPIALLHTGHWENITAAFQIQFFSTVLLCALLLYTGLIPPLRDDLGRLHLPRLITLTILLLLLGLTGGNGLVFVPFGGLYLLGIGVADLRHCWNRSAAMSVLGGGLTFLLCALYFMGDVFVDQNQPAPVAPLWIAVQCALNYLLMGFGHGAAPRWDGARDSQLLAWFLAIGGVWGGVLALRARERNPGVIFAGAGYLLIPLASAGAAYAVCHTSTVVPYLAAHMLAVPALSAFAAWGVAFSLRRADAERRRRFLFLAVFVLGTIAAAAGVARARAGGGGVDAGLIARYGLMAVQLLIGLYFAALLTVKERFAHRFLPAVLLALSLVFLGSNRDEGKRLGDEKRRFLTAFAENAVRGLPIEPLAVAGSARVHPSEESLLTGIKALQQARHAPFDRVRVDDILIRRELPLPTPRRIFSTTSDATVRMPLGTPAGSGRVRAVVAIYQLSHDCPPHAGYQFATVRHDPATSTFVQNGDAVLVPHRGVGAIALQPNALSDVLEIRPVRDGGNNPPAEIVIKQVVVFYSP